MKKVIEEHENLVKVNLEYLKNLGIETYKEIFINYPDMFLMDASNFEESFSKYDKAELIEKLNANFKMVKYLYKIITLAIIFFVRYTNFFQVY